MHERTGDKKCSSQVPWLLIVLSIIELLFLAECALCFLCMLREGKYICLCTLLAAGADSARLSEPAFAPLNFLHTSQKRVGSNRPAQGRALPWVLYELS